MFALEVGFPGGRFYGASADAPAAAEWPPHPSRLYSALVASACAGGAMTDQQRAALLWLESQSAPRIEAPMADTRPYPVSYVPPGDCNRQKGKIEHPVFRIRKDRYFPAAY